MRTIFAIFKANSTYLYFTIFTIIVALPTLTIRAHGNDAVVETREINANQADAAPLGEKKLDEHGILGAPERFSGELRKTLFVRRGGKPVRGEPGCNHPHVNCEEVCFNVPSIPTRYRVVLDGKWSAVHEDPPSSYFNATPGGAWARFQETLWQPRGNGRYKVCFQAKNWKHDWDRSFNIEVRF